MAAKPKERRREKRDGGERVEENKSSTKFSAGVRKTNERGGEREKEREPEGEG